MNQPGKSQEQINEEVWEDPASWRYGLFYYAVGDSRAWVPKRSLLGRRRYGGTPNFAKPSARKLMMVVVGALVMMVLFIMALERTAQLP